MNTTLSDFITINNVRKKMYGNIRKPNPNISTSRIEYIFRFYRLKHFVFYLLQSFKVISFKSRVNLKDKKVFYICANSITHSNVLKSFRANEFDTIMLPVNFDVKNIPSEYTVGANVIKIEDCLSLNNLKKSISMSLKMILTTPELSFFDFFWLNSTLIEKGIFKSLNINHVFLTHHLDAAALPFTLIETPITVESGLHGFPASDYGWTPVWTDSFYVYGESTNEYIKKLDPLSVDKLNTYPISEINVPVTDYIYEPNFLGIISGGSYEDVHNICSELATNLILDEIDKIVIFRHPSRMLSTKELTVLKSLNRPLEVTTLSSYDSNVIFRCVIGNSTAILSSLIKGMIVFKSKTNLPINKDFFPCDEIVISELSRVNEYEYIGLLKQRESIKKQIDFHYSS